MKKAVIFGAGKIARGFIAHLLYLSGYQITFIDVDEKLVKLLNTYQSYGVHILGNEAKNANISHYEAVLLENRQEVIKHIKEANVLFTAVGGKHLSNLGKLLKEYIEHQSLPHQSMIICENWVDSAATIQKELGLDSPIQCAEAVVMRTATNGPKNHISEAPLDVWVQDFWELYVDEEKVSTVFPAIQGLVKKGKFDTFLTQKMYTNNTSNAVIAYFGYELGYTYIADAANAPEMQEILDETYREINEILVKGLNIDESSQDDMARKARKKYSDRNIVDYVTRHGQDPIRKLGPKDRLIGPCRLAFKNGINPKILIQAIVKALHFDYKEDASALQLQQMIKEKGIEEVLRQVCCLSEDEPLYQAILEEFEKNDE